MAKYKKKPVVIDAWAVDDIRALAPVKSQRLDVEVEKAIANGVIEVRPGELCIHTLEGQMIARPGDMLIRGVQGEFYPCKADIFYETYEEAEDEDL